MGVPLDSTGLRAQHKKIAKQKRMSNIEQGILNVEGRNVANLILKGI